MPTASALTAVGGYGVLLSLADVTNTFLKATMRELGSASKRSDTPDGDEVLEWTRKNELLRGLKLFEAGPVYLFVTPMEHLISVDELASKSESEFSADFDERLNQIVAAFQINECFGVGRWLFSGPIEEGIVEVTFEPSSSLVEQKAPTIPIESVEQKEEYSKEDLYTVAMKERAQKVSSTSVVIPTMGIQVVALVKDPTSMQTAEEEDASSSSSDSSFDETYWPSGYFIPKHYDGGDADIDQYIKEGHQDEDLVYDPCSEDDGSE